MQAGIEGGESTGLVVVVREEGFQVEVLVDHLGDDAGEVVLGEPLIEVRREKERLLRIGTCGRLGHSRWACSPIGEAGYSTSVRVPVSARGE